MCNFSIFCKTQVLNASDIVCIPLPDRFPLFLKPSAQFVPSPDPSTVSRILSELAYFFDKFLHVCSKVLPSFFYFPSYSSQIPVSATFLSKQAPQLLFVHISKPLLLLVYLLVFLYIQMTSLTASRAPSSTFPLLYRFGFLLVSSALNLPLAIPSFQHSLLPLEDLLPFFRLLIFSVISSTALRSCSSTFEGDIGSHV